MARSKPPKVYPPLVQLVIERSGGPSALARVLGVVPSAITQWLRIPTRHARAVERITGIPLHVQRPDVWEAPSQ